MRILFFAIFLGTLVVVPILAQSDSGVGSIVVRAKNVKGPNRAKIPLARKRFYLFRGGLAENQALIDRIKTLDLASRDCFYANQQASPCFIEWLNAENCETPFCRPIKRDEIPGIKEFETAYAKGLASYRNRPDIALSWMINNLPANLTTGYYRYHKTMIQKALEGSRPLQTILSTSAGAEATFPGVPVTGKTTKYFVTNLLPVEIGSKTYVWGCEIDVQSAKPSALILALPLDPKRKNCTLIEKELKACSTGGCEKKK